MTSITLDAQLEIRLKTLWGAAAMPFAPEVTQLFWTAATQELLNHLRQMLALRSHGLLHGSNGVGKTVLVDALLAALPEKLFAPTRLAHSSLSGSDLLRAFCHALGLPPQMRRSDNIHQIHGHWQSLGALHPVLVVDEAQNLSAQALEELRLLGCAPRRSAQPPPFSLLLVGDDDLLPRLQMGIHRPLRSRLGFSLAMTPFTEEQTLAYLSDRWRHVGVAQDPFQENAQKLLHQGAGGVARTLNQLAQLAILHAARSNQRQLSADHVRAALDQIPWIARLSQEKS